MKQEEPLLRDERGTPAPSRPARKLRITLVAFGFVLATSAGLWLGSDSGRYDPVPLIVEGVGVDRHGWHVVSFTITNKARRAVDISGFALESTISKKTLPIASHHGRIGKLTPGSYYTDSFHVPREVLQKMEIYPGLTVFDQPMAPGMERMKLQMTWSYVPTRFEIWRSKILTKVTRPMGVTLGIAAHTNYSAEFSW